MKTIIIVLLLITAYSGISQSIYRQWENDYSPKDMLLVENDDYVIAYFTNGSEGKLLKFNASTGLIEVEVEVKPYPKIYIHTNTLLNTKVKNVFIYMTGDSNNTGFYLEYYDTGKLELIKRSHFLYDNSSPDSLFENKLINFNKSIIDSKNEKLYVVIRKDLDIDTSIVVVYDLETGYETDRLPYVFGKNEKVNIALSPDESKLVTYSTGLDFIKVWNLNTLELIESYPPKGKQSSGNSFNAPVDVKFSTNDPNIIYILGMRGYRSNERRGIYKYSISKNDIIKEISQGLEIDTQKLVFFDDETRVLRFNERILNIFNLEADSSEYFKYWGSTLPLEMNVLYSEWHDLFIVSGNRSMNGLRYFRPEVSSINYLPKSEYIIFPNPATTVLSINLQKDLLAYRYKILDSEGKLIISNYSLPLNSITIDTGTIPNGHYMIEIETTTRDLIRESFLKE